MEPKLQVIKHSHTHTPAQPVPISIPIPTLPLELRSSVPRDVSHRPGIQNPSPVHVFGWRGHHHGYVHTCFGRVCECEYMCIYTCIYTSVCYIQDIEGLCFINVFVNACKWPYLTHRHKTPWAHSHIPLFSIRLRCDERKESKLGRRPHFCWLEGNLVCMHRRARA